MNPATKVNAYLAAAEDARKQLQKTASIKLSCLDIQLGLMDIFGIDDETELLNKELASNNIIELLKDFNFNKYHLEDLAEIVFEESIIPPGTERTLLEARIKHKNEIWIIRKGDPDPLPSNPHAHNYDSNIKIHLGNGDLYRNGRIVGQLGKREFESLRSKIEAMNIELPKLER